MSDNDLLAAVAHIKRITPPADPWDTSDIGGGSCALLTDRAIAAILNAVASGDLVPRADLPPTLVRSMRRILHEASKDEGSLQTIFDIAREALRDKPALAAALELPEIKALVETVIHERGMVCQDFGLQLAASNAVDAALAAIKENCNE